MSPACNKQPVKSQQRFRNVPITNVNVNFSNWAGEHCERSLPLCREDTKERKTEKGAYSNNIRHQFPSAYHIKFRICEFGMTTSVLLNHRAVLDIKLDVLKMPSTIQRSPTQMVVVNWQNSAWMKPSSRESDL